MANVLLKFVENSKNPDAQVIAFFRKKVCFVLKESEHMPKAGEFWECFMWADRKKFYLVKPFRKIDPEKVKEEQARVDQFNKELFLIEKHKNADFPKVVFDDNNKPYLVSEKPKRALERDPKYESFILKEAERDGKTVTLGRPVLNAEDRKEWQKSH